MDKLDHFIPKLTKPKRIIHIGILGFVVLGPTKILPGCCRIRVPANNESRWTTSGSFYNVL